MCRRVLDELERNSSAIGLLQGIYKAAVAIFEILVDNFELAFELNLWASGLPLSGGGGVIAVCVGGVRENECAAEEHEAEENRTAEDLGGTDLDLHG
jgi:hypothetical protein